ncbi:MAG: hypothetical protein NZ585_08440 [Chloracidobacterium sp.]|nr:hypothetical protein [Chloracidobacterium sp.]
MVGKLNFRQKPPPSKMSQWTFNQLNNNQSLNEIMGRNFTRPMGLEGNKGNSSKRLF